MRFLKNIIIAGLLLFFPASVFASTYSGVIYYTDYSDEEIDADYSVGSPTATFAATRGANNPATYFDSSGVMQKTETSTVPRYNHGYYNTTGYHAFSQAGVLIEGASTNYLKQGIFAAGAGTATNWTITEDDTNEDTPTLVDVSSTFNVGTTVQSQRIQMTFAGDGTYLLLNSDATAAASFAQNDNVTVSVWIKGTITGLTLKLGYNEYDNLAALGTAHKGSDIASSISATDWRRFTYSLAAADADCDNVKATFWVEGISAADACDLQFACAQVEKLPHATTFIPTTAAALTRNAETLKYPIAGNRSAAVESCVVKLAPEWVSSLTGSKRIQATDTKKRIFNFGDTDDVAIYSNQTDSAGSVVLDLINTAWTAHTEMTLGYAMQHSSPYIAGYYNGVADGTNETADDFTNPAWGTYFWVGSENNGTEQLNGTIFSIAFFNRVLTATEMKEVYDDMEAGNSLVFNMLMLDEEN